MELVVHGRLVSVRSSRTRRLLAMLALYRDRIVSNDRLADAVWGESLPADPAAALQNQISRLRTALGRAAPGIETTSGGYRLCTDVVGIDLVTFESTLATARDERHRVRRAELLAEAIGMVRGAAFEDLEVEDAYIEARRVDGLLTGARQAHADATIEPAASARAMGRRVPRPTVEVVGREDDLAVVSELLTSKRVVTLTGPGGVGKTTLALLAIDRFCRQMSWPSAFVDLSAASSSHDVPNAFARALGVERAGAEGWSDRLIDAIGHDAVLLFVDNAEHLLDAAAHIIGDLVARTDIVVVTTSRVALGIPGEHLWVVEPLEPEGPALDLFTQRARTVRPTWSASAEEARWVGVICERVDGLPLGIELAAAQLQWRTPAEIAASLARPLDALEPVDAGRGRHAGLRTVIDGSYQLLSAQQQSCLDQLGVFVGGFTATVAAQVLFPAPGDSDSAARLIGSLVARSLVRVAPRPESTRYTLFDTVRHYALERLEEDARREGTRARHAHAMLDLTVCAVRDMWCSDEPAWVRRLDDERADICAAHRHLVDQGDIEGALRLATAAYVVCWPRGWSDLAQLVGESIAAAGSVAPDVLAPALGAAADVALHDGDSDRAAHLARRSVVVAGGRPELTFLAEAVLGDVALFAGDTDRAVSTWRKAAEAWTSAVPGLAPWATSAVSLALAHAGRYDEATMEATDALERADRSGCPTSRAFARYAAAEACVGTQPDEAAALLVESIAVALEASAAFVANLSRLTLATLTARRGDPVGALGHYPLVLQEWRRSGHGAQQWNTLRTVVPILAHVGALDEAATLLGGLRAQDRAASWGPDAAELEEAHELLARGLRGGYRDVLDRGAALTPSELALFAESATTRWSDRESDA